MSVPCLPPHVPCFLGGGGRLRILVPALGLLEAGFFSAQGIPSVALVGQPRFRNPGCT